MSIFTIIHLTRVKLGVGVLVNFLEALVISTMASKFLFVEILFRCCIRDLRGKGDDEGLLCSRRAELAQPQSPPARARLPGNGVRFRERRVRRKGHRG